VLLVQEVETYILVPKYPDTGFKELVEAASYEISAVIGNVGPIASADMCNGLPLPLLYFDVIYNLNKEDFVNQIPVPEGVNEADFRGVGRALFEQVVPQIYLGVGPNRAFAYLLLSDDSLYRLVAAKQLNNSELKSLTVQQAPAAARNLVYVMAKFVSRVDRMEEIYFRALDVGGKLVFGVGELWKPWAGSSY
jgi:hypothetical protein